MPAGTPVDRMYQALLREGNDPGKAARIAQAQTGLALATGKPPKGKSKKAGPGAMNYPSWTTQSQKAAGDLLDLPSRHLKYNENHDERGRFSSGSGGGGSFYAAMARGKSKGSSLKSLQAAFKTTVKQRKTIDKSMSTLRGRMAQLKRSSPAYKRSFDRMQSLKLQRTELTRDLNRLSSAIARRSGPKVTQDWVQSILAGIPVTRQTSSRPSRKSADADLFEIRSFF